VSSVSPGAGDVTATRKAIAAAQANRVGSPRGRRQVARPANQAHSGTSGPSPRSQHH
jgi:hypothetical protein